MASYPPTNHLLRDLRASSVWRTEDELVLFAPLDPHFRGADNGCRVGVLAALIDVAGAQVVMPAIGGDWVATLDLAYHSTAPLVDGPVVIVARLVRAGSAIAIAEADLFAGEGAEATTTPAGRSLITFRRLPNTASDTVVLDRSVTVGERNDMFDGDSSLDRPIFDAVGIRALQPAPDTDARNEARGRVEVAKVSYVLNSIGTINGGVIAMTAEAAALHAVGDGGVSLEHGAVVDLVVRYLGQVKEGPVRTTATIIRNRGGHAVVEVEMIDASSGRLIALATVGVDV